MDGYVALRRLCTTGLFFFLLLVLLRGLVEESIFLVVEVNLKVFYFYFYSLYFSWRGLYRAANTKRCGDSEEKAKGKFDFLFCFVYEMDL